MKLACAGDCVVDYYDDRKQGFPGGNAVNTAVYFRRLGGEASYIGAVGQDAAGRQLKEALKEKGVDLDCGVDEKSFIDAVAARFCGGKSL